jgi:hypothetical protein
LSTKKNSSSELYVPGVPFRFSSTDAPDCARRNPKLDRIRLSSFFIDAICQGNQSNESNRRQ